LVVILLNFFVIGAGNCTNVIAKDLFSKVSNVYIFDSSKEKVEELKKVYSNVIYSDFSDIDKLNIDYVIECASVDAVIRYSEKILDLNTNYVIISSGAFGDDLFRERFMEKLNVSNCNVFIPSGAVGGIDLIHSLGDSVEKIVLNTRKSPKSFGIDTFEEKIIFEGGCKEAIKRFPQNINVAITLALAVKDFEKVHVIITADPYVKSNSHNITIESKIGRYSLNLENYPSDNAKTSLLAPLSIIGLINKLNNNFKVGV